MVRGAEKFLGPVKRSPPPTSPNGTGYDDRKMKSLTVRLYVALNLRRAFGRFLRVFLSSLSRRRLVNTDTRARSETKACLERT